MNILDGKAVRNSILSELKEKIEKEENKVGLAIIYVGHNDASDVYVKNKLKYAKEVGIDAIVYNMSKDTTEKSLYNLIFDLNCDPRVHGIILQSPIPDHLNFDRISNFIDSSKDVDGFTTDSVYANYTKEEGFIPCTVKGIIRLLEYYNIPIEGKNVVIVGRGLIVGKPLALSMLNLNATVTIAHSKTTNLKDVCKNADILISAVGKPGLIKEDFVKEGAIVIDVGINKVDDKLVGDVQFDKVKDKCSYITPVPGGVGPMTIAMLLENTYDAYKGIQRKRLKQED